MRNLFMTSALALVLASCGGEDSAAQTGAAAPSGQPWETRAANAPSQQPAFAGQTRAPEVSADIAYTVETVATGLDKPWAIAFLPDGRMLVTEKPGRLRIVTGEGQLSEPVSGLPEVDARDQGGLLDVALDPEFAQNSLIYWSYAEPRDGAPTPPPWPAAGWWRTAPAPGWRTSRSSTSRSRRSIPPSTSATAWCSTARAGF